VSQLNIRIISNNCSAKLVKKGKISFGCYIYQDGLEYKDIQHTVLVCERLGFDSVWLKDNFIPWIQAYLSNEKEGQEIKKEKVHQCLNVGQRSLP